MESFHEDMNEYKTQLEKGTIQRAYKGLMDYIRGLRTHFYKRFPDRFETGSLYYGSMDMTYFPILPISLKQKGLKIAVVFLYDSFRFEVWLAGYNKQIQEKYWKFFKECEWDKYHLVPSTKGADSILEYVVVEKPDFNNLDALTKQIEKETLKFISDVEGFLTKHEK